MRYRHLSTESIDIAFDDGPEFDSAPLLSFRQVHEIADILADFGLPQELSFDILDRAGIVASRLVAHRDEYTEVIGWDNTLHAKAAIPANIPGNLVDCVMFETISKHGRREADHEMEVPWTYFCAGSLEKETDRRLDAFGVILSNDKTTDVFMRNRVKWSRSQSHFKETFELLEAGNLVGLEVCGMNRCAVNVVASASIIFQYRAYMMSKSEAPSQTNLLV